MYISKRITNVFVTCCSSSFLMEILMARAPFCANLITFLQFFWISLYGFVFTVNFGRTAPKIPLSQYALLVFLFFVTNVANNYVYALHVPSTLHMIIRSASSPAIMLVYWYATKQVPKVHKLIGSILITIGVVLAMYAGATVAENNKGTFLYWCLGVAILLATLITGAYTGLQQEKLYSKFGKHPDEMLFYTHALPLPLFFGINSQLVETISLMTWQLWILIVLNIVSQFYCARSVHQLASKETSVNVTFILTLRKFVSLLISSLVFKNSITFLHIYGTILVSLGTYIYFDCFILRPVSDKER